MSHASAESPRASAASAIAIRSAAIRSSGPPWPGAGMWLSPADTAAVISRFGPRERGDARRHALQGRCVHLVESGEIVAVHVENTQETAAGNDRHDDLAARPGVARDVAGELLDVGDQHRLPTRRGGAAHAA